MKILSSIIKCIFLTLVFAIEAQAQNNAPIAASQTLTLYQDTLYNGQFSASDADEHPLTYSITTQPAAGTLTLVDPATGAYTYLPVPGYTGPISFGFRAYDGLDYSNDATISTTIRSRIYYKEDFEDDDHSFTFSGGLWKITQNFPRTGSRALGYVQNDTPGSSPNGNFNTNNSPNTGTVTSPSISVPENARLNISAFYAGENGQTWDIFRVFVVSEGQENLILVSYNNFTDNFYKDFNLDFSAYANKNITLKFTFATGDGQLNDYPGVRVDDIIVYVPPTGPAAITLAGNNSFISNGDSTPSSEDHTDFGTVNQSLNASIKRTFTIANTGGQTLNLTGTPRVQITGDSAFSLTIPPNATVAGGITTTFDITFNPSAFGSKTALVTIPNNDTTQNPFTFTIKGTLPAPSPTVTVGAATDITGYEATLHGGVNPNDAAASYHFEYSTDSTLTNPSSTASGSLSSGSSEVPVSIKVTQLLPETKYYYRLVGSNEISQDETEILSFTTSYPLASATTYVTADGLSGGGAMYRPMPGIINNEGRILFQSTGLTNSGGGTVTPANDGWLMNDVTGTPMIIIREGDQLGSNSGHYFTGLFNHLLLGNSGQSVVSEKLSGTTASNDLAYLAVTTPGTVEIVSQEGNAAPGGGTLTNSVGKPVMDSNEVIYFQGNTSGIATNRSTGVWYDDGSGNLKALIRAGYDLTSVTGDNAWLGKVSNIIAAGGNGTAFVAGLLPNPANTKQKTNVLRNQVILSISPGTPNTYSVVARKGDAIVGVNNSKMNNITALSRGSNGDHAYLGLMKIAPGITKSNDQVLVAPVNGQSILVAREGITNLTAGLTPKSFGKFFVTNNGHVIFQAVLNGATATSDGIVCLWNANTRVITVLAREGSTAPGTGGLNYGTLQNISVSDNGNIALQSLLSNAKIGLFRNMGAGFELVVKAGTGVADRVNYLGLDRNIASLSIYSQNTGTGNGGGGMGSAINDAGDIFTVLSLGGTHYVARVYRGPVISAPQ